MHPGIPQATQKVRKNVYIYKMWLRSPDFWIVWLPHYSEIPQLTAAATHLAPCEYSHTTCRTQLGPPTLEWAACIGHTFVKKVHNKKSSQVNLHPTHLPWGVHHTEMKTIFCDERLKTNHHSIPPDWIDLPEENNSKRRDKTRLFIVNFFSLCSDLSYYLMCRHYL